MKCILALLASAATASARSYLAEMADSYIRRGVIGGFRYDEATLYKGLEALIEVNGNETIKEWYKNQIDNRVLNPDGTIQKWNYEIYSLDDYRVSNSFMYWHQETESEERRGRRHHPPAAHCQAAPEPRGRLLAPHSRPGVCQPDVA